MRHRVGRAPLRLHVADHLTLDLLGRQHVAGACLQLAHAHRHVPQRVGAGHDGNLEALFLVARQAQLHALACRHGKRHVAGQNLLHRGGEADQHWRGRPAQAVAVTPEARDRHQAVGLLRQPRGLPAERLQARQGEGRGPAPCASPRSSLHPGDLLLGLRLRGGVSASRSRVARQRVAVRSNVPRLPSSSGHLADEGAGRLRRLLARPQEREIAQVRVMLLAGRSV